MCHKETHRIESLEGRKVVSNAITVLPPANVDLFVQKTPVFSVCTEIRIVDALEHIPPVENWLRIKNLGCLESAIGKTTVDGGLLYSTLEIFIGK
jgi:hypothetical protein